MTPCRRATLADIEAVNEWGQGDYSAFLADPLNVYLISGNGGALFAWRAPDVFEVHVVLEQRGKAAFAVMHEMLDYMRTNCGARLFWTAIPPASRHVIMFARRMGWKSRGLAKFAHGICEIFVEGY